MNRPPCYLSPGQEADVAAIDAIERESFSRPWTAAQLREVLRAGRVVALRGHDTGVTAYCVFHRVAGELQIQTVAVATELRRRGLARTLIAWLLEAAGRDGLELAVLEVRASNQAARNLYTQLGFCELARRPGSLSEPDQIGLILSRSVAESRSDRALLAVEFGAAR